VLHDRRPAGAVRDDGTRPVLITIAIRLIPGDGTEAG
jgi:hypothetical protein